MTAREQVVRADERRAVALVVDAMANGRTVTVDNRGGAQ